MKKIVLTLLIAFSIMNCTLLVYAGNKTGQEVGDVVFRRLAAPWDKHSAIYIGYNTENPEADANHYVIEEEGDSPKNGARKISFSTFKNGGPFGANLDYYGSMERGYISKKTRIEGPINIISTAKGLICDV